MKLKIKPFEETPKIPIPAIRDKENEYKTPVRWWVVTTEGDEEGRSVKSFGSWYGHVAEIALHLADKAMYEIEFSPDTNLNSPPKIYPSYSAKSKSVYIGLGIGSGTWDLRDDARIKWWEKWLNTEELKVTKGYYKSVNISLR